MRSFEQHTVLPDAKSVTAGSTAVFDIPLGWRYKQINLVAYSAAKTTATIYGEIRLVVNDKVQRAFTITELDTINKLNGAQYGISNDTSGSASNVPIFFSHPWAKEMASQEAFAWNTRGWQSFRIEVDLLAGAGAVVLKADCVRDVADKADDFIQKWYRQGIPAPASGAGVSVEFDYGDLPTTRGPIQQINLFDANITLGRLELQSEVKRRWENSIRLNALLTMRDMFPAAGASHIVLDHNDDAGGSLFVGGARDLNLHLGRGAAGALAAANVNTIVQIIGQPD